MNSQYLKLLREDIDTQSLEYLCEGEGDQKIWKIKGPMIVAETLNGNRRIYSESDCDRETMSFLKQKEHNRLGE